MDNRDISHQSRSIMIVSNRDAFGQEVSNAFATDENSTVTTENDSFKSMNGRAGRLVFDFDVVIFEADPDDDGEVEAIRDLLSKRTGDTVFLALTHNDVSIVKVRELRKIGIDEVLPMSTDSEGIRSVIGEQIRARRGPEPSVHDGPLALGQVIPVTQSRGGAGSTTVAVNLASSLADGGKSIFQKASKRSVVLLDFDLQFGNSNVLLDLEDNGGFLQIIDSVKAVDDRMVASTLQRHPLGFDVLCAPAQVIPLQSVRPDLVENMLDILKKRYDYIIVDLPRAAVDWVEPVLKCAAQLVIVSDTSVPSVRQTRRLMELYREESVALSVTVVINRERKPFIKSEHIREAEKVLEAKFIHWLPDQPKVARKAVDLGRPIIEMKPRSDLGKALKLLASAMTAAEQHVQRKNN
ncbi:MAG: AAA family ATPase [Sulfitobacter sp.]|nr:AAA family ATPase [Sulfitobacter sp.]